MRMAWTTIVGRSEFIFEILLLEYLYGIYLKRKPQFWQRFLAGVLLCFIADYFVIQSGGSMWSSIPHVIILFSLSICMMSVCYESKFWEIFFIAAAAYTSQAIIYSVFIMLQTTLEVTFGWKLGILYVCVLAVCVSICYFFMVRRLRFKDGVNVDNRILIVLVFVTGLIDTVFKFYMVEQGLGIGIGGVFIAWKSVSMLACILVLCVQFGILSQNSARAEQRELENLLYQKEQQFKASRENIELINIKCHDLRHWLGRLERLEGEEFAQEAEEMKRALSIYDSSFQTGNGTLDTILMEKKLYCDYNKINLTCIAEGARLEIFSTAEICSLFGNILDNAIEAVSGIQEESRRSISLTIRTRGQMISIHEENFYDGILEQKNGIFETTKEDKRHHGFGIKSIQMIVDSHQGSMSILAQDGIFNLNILIS